MLRAFVRAAALTWIAGAAAVALVAAACGPDTPVVRGDADAATQASSASSIAATSSSSGGAGGAGHGGGGGGGSSGSGPCAQFCAATMAAACDVPGDCEAACEQSLSKSPDCDDKIVSYLDCRVAHVADANGCSLPTACVNDYEQSAICQSTACGAESCSGAAPDCSCSGTCSGHAVTSQCSGGVCSCIVDGATLAMCTEEQGGCDLKSTCCALVFISI